LKVPLSVIILTLNEEQNIEDCLKSIYGWVGDIFIVDSFSADRTIEIARKYTDKIYQHAFETHARQFDWAVQNANIQTEWVLRLDADERISPGLKEELLANLPGIDKSITGIYVRRKVFFMGKWIRHGGYYPLWLLRIYRPGYAKIEDRFMDEHIVLLRGMALALRNDLEERNQKGLTEWIVKHNDYAAREAVDTVNFTAKDLINTSLQASFFGRQALRKRWLKNNIYLRLPLFIRPLLYFAYRYFLLLGFLDGKEGLIFHFLHGFWYRFLVDAKIYEMRQRALPRI